MDWMTFTTNLVDAIAWPVCLIAIVCLFRGEISSLLKRIVRGKFAGGEFEFSENANEQLENAEQVSTYGPGADSESGSPETHSLDAAYNLLDTLPRAAVIEAWRQLCGAALCRIEIDDSSSSSSEDAAPAWPSPARLARYLRQQGVLTPDQLALFDELRRLRNIAVHGDDSEIDERKAKQYLVLAEFLIEKLEDDCSESWLM